MKSPDSLPLLSFEDADAMGRWLEERHATASGLWLRIAKKDSGTSTLQYAAALEVALCYGWIDGQKKALDARYWLQKFTPRRPKSIWSRINREKATRLIAEGRMRPAGLAQVEAAKSDGRWDAAYQSQGNSTVPDDLQRALDKDGRAQAFFDALNSVNRYAILFRIQNAKKAETRAARIEKFVAMLSEGKKIYP